MTTPKNAHAFYDLFTGHDITLSDGSTFTRRPRLFLSSGFITVDQGRELDRTLIDVEPTYAWTHSENYTSSGSTDHLVATLDPLPYADPLTTSSFGFECSVLERNPITNGNSLYVMHGHITRNQLVASSGTIDGIWNPYDGTGEATKFNITTSGSTFFLSASRTTQDNTTYRTYWRSSESDPHFLQYNQGLPAYPRIRGRNYVQMPGVRGNRILDENGQPLPKRSDLVFGQTMNVDEFEDKARITHRGDVVPFHSASSLILSGVTGGPCLTIDWNRLGTWSWRGWATLGDPNKLNWTMYELSGLITNLTQSVTTSGSIYYRSLTDTLHTGTISFYTSLANDNLNIYASQSLGMSYDEAYNQINMYAAIDWGNDDV